ncbi:MAG TPA: PQQ-binding-like beta-propeller repeat protein [Gemmataceae bacterium]|jgi:outer membrane protein assembly factor BamB
MAIDTELPLSQTQLERTTAQVVKPPHYWPGVVMLAMYWAYAFSCRHLELSMLVLFLSRMAALLLLLLGFSIWWLTNRRIARRERWMAVAVTLGGAALAVPLTLTTLGPAVVVLGLLFVFTLGTLWLVVSKRATPRVRRWGLWTTICLVWVGCTLVRWNGLNGDQESDVRWRWQPTAEELFLAEHSSAGDANDGAAVELMPGDWPEFRGAGREGRVEDSGLALDWNAYPPQSVWKKRVGPGWSSLIVVGGRLYTQEQRGRVETVVCYKAATGDELWEHKEEGRFEETVSGPGPRATPTFADGRIYAVGARGKLSCLDAANGRAIWSRDLAADAGASVPQWGFSSSPLVVEGLVVAYAGGPDQGLLAYRADTGDPAWQVATGKNTYSSPQLVSLDGTKQILFLSDSGLIGIEPSRGVVLWECSLKGMPAIQPHVVGDMEILTPAGDGLSLVKIHHRGDVWSAEQRWSSRALRPSFNDVVVHDGAIYGLDEGIFCCVDLQTGKRRWKGERYGHATMVFLVEPSLLLVISEKKGTAILLPADPEPQDERGRFQAIEGKTWNHPVIAHGRLYLRNDEEMVCYELHQ